MQVRNGSILATSQDKVKCWRKWVIHDSAYMPYLVVMGRMFNLVAQSAISHISTEPRCGALVHGAKIQGCHGE